MTITISISDLRKNIASYLEKAAGGVNVIIRDEKKNKTIARIIGAHSFNKSDYEKALRVSSGVLSNKHIEWKDRSSINKWLEKSREKADRKIN